MNAPIKPPDTSEALAFLSLLRPGGPWTLAAITPDVKAPPIIKHCTTLDHAASFIAEQGAAARNLHLQVNPMTPACRKQGDKAIEWLAFCHLDLDKNREGIRLSTPELKQTARSEIEAFKPPPTFIIDSGNGLLGLWRIAGGGLAPTKENVEAVRSANVGLALAFGGDSVGAPSQLLRLPGTLNLPDRVKRDKYGIGPAGAVLLVDTDNETSLADLPRKALAAAGDEYTTPIGEAMGVEDRSELREWHVPDHLLRIIEHGEDAENVKPSRPQSRSAWMFKAVRGLIGCRVPDEIIKGLLLDPAWGISAHVLEHAKPDKYADKQIRDAHQKLNAESAAEDKLFAEAAALDDDLQLEYGESMEPPARSAGAAPDKFAPLYKLGPADEPKLYDPAGHLGLLAELKDTDAPRYIELLRAFKENRIPRLAELERVVKRHIRDVKEAEKLKRSRDTMSESEGFDLDSKGNKTPSQANILRAIQFLEVKLRYDSFNGEPIIEGLEGRGPTLDDRAMNRLWLTVDKQFGFRPPLPFFQIVVSDACDMDRFHPVLDHIDGLHWDGIRRLDTWLIRYCGAADTPFHRAVGRHVLVAAVRRIRQPGAKFDVLTVLESAEGSGKSSLLSALAMRDKWFSDSVALNVDDKKMIESTAGKFIIEISELTGMRKGEIEKIKAQLSRQSDRARLAYGRLPVEIPRQFVAFATTNDEKYLAGLTGNRRFWPVTVGEIKLEEFRHDVDQIWAEASLAELTGESIVLDRHLWSEAVKAQTERELENPFVDTLADTLEDRCGYVMVADLWSILDISPGRVTQHQQVMLGKAMLELGFTKQRREHKGHKRTAFIRRPAEGQAQRLRFNRGGGPSWCHTEVDPLT